MKLVALLSIVFAITKLEKPTLLQGMNPTTTIGIGNSILVAGSNEDMTLSSMLVRKYDATTLGLQWAKQVPSTKGALTSRPDTACMITVGNLVYILSTERFGTDSLIQSQLVLVALDVVTGTLKSKVIVPGPKLPTVSLSIGMSIVKSNTPNKLYLTATSLMDTSKARYGYTIHKFDTSTGTIDWTRNYLPRSSVDGGSFEQALEVGTTLFVVGGLGVVSIDSATGLVTPISIPNAASFSTIASSTNGTILVSNYQVTVAIHSITKKVLYVANVPGFVRPIYPFKNTIFTAGVEAVGFNTADWKYRIGVLNTTTGSLLFPPISGSKGDSYVGASMEKNIITVLFKGTSKVGCWFFGFGCRTIDNMSIVQLNGSGKRLFPTNEDQNKLATSAVASTGASLHGAIVGKVWGISYDGGVTVWTL